ncbi:gustatory receptor for sugar taste 43a-like isoform X2 [Frankliniella occidentalis]|uniref:Gustatory receptor n=1 Tax=Frankliniella occidentalis TaxID=133901 RepID=A0A9C6U6C8_FRAOC|nr:gustatory receptor for sugar taste 43a-like isoform X2 [Frankliniella occidentalis]
MESFERTNDWLWPTSRLFGLLPMSLQRCQCAVQRRRLRPLERLSVPGGPRWARCWCPPLAPSLGWLLYSLSLMTLVVGWTAYKLVHKYADMSLLDEALAANVTSTSGQETTRLVGLFDMTTISVIAAVCVLQAATTQHLVLRLNAQLRRVDSLLAPRAYAVPRWLLVFLMTLSFVALLDLFYKLCDDEQYAIHTMPSYLAYIITYMREAMFVDDVSGVRARFRTINAELTDCLSDYPAAEVHETVVNTDRKSRAIGRLATAYDLLCQCVESVARQHSLFLLCNMLGLVVRLVVTTYFIVDLVLESDAFAEVRPEPPPSLRSMFVTIQVLWLACHFLRMLALVQPCSSTIEEALLTGSIVSRSVSYEMLDGQISVQLKSLSMHLLHRKITVSAFGVFDLSLPLVCTVSTARVEMCATLFTLDLIDSLSLPGDERRHYVPCSAHTAEATQPRRGPLIRMPK